MKSLHRTGFILLTIVFLSQFAFGQRGKFSGTQMSWKIKPSGTVIDTISFLKIKTDTIAIFETPDFICYTNGSMLFNYLHERIQYEKEMASDPTEPKRPGCLDWFEDKLEAASFQLTKSDTLYLNKLKLSEKLACTENEDIQGKLLSQSLLRVYNKKSKSFESIMILYQKHTEQEWFDRIQTTKGQVIYKGIGTLDRF